VNFFRQSMIGFELAWETFGSTATLTNKLQRHLTWLREILNLYKKKQFSRNFKNPKKFWKSGKNWNSRFQNFEKIDLIILPNRSNRSYRKKSLNRLDRFIGQRINIPILPKTGPFRGVFWMIRFSTFCTKTHFSEKQKSWPQAVWELATWV